ncbi:Gfo/Idh/MocA family oxidoreductase [Spirulina subsalsa FACHB-351]|uniref:Gfo/Idh/MocA family oxidoreductase n=1 Tax=Spirulina subsalsa FACHB-351 TaxID=234711 RepID=A0ABT3L4A5_9CYAN|nr:Gfo/Idh/MocA family oxidoreductase [Spirulina subsalsa]MCW6036287.1 Gfo/Idh/MocA family oxidoreductase [Spirulina subsalsa FACHB-351]
MMIKIALLGVGRWGKHWARVCSQHPQIDLVAVVDSNPDKLAECGANLPPQVIQTTDWASIREHPDLNAVLVATPAATHYALIRDALTLGYHVLAEKPLTLDPAECRHLCQLAQEKQVQLLVDHTYLFNPAVAAGQRAVESGTLGELRYGYATRTHLAPVRQDVDALWDLAIHDLAIFSHWLGEKPQTVQATGQVWLQPQLKMAVPAVSESLRVRDLVWVTVTYPSGFQGVIHLCWLNPDKQRRLCVVGSQGTLIFDELAGDAPLTIQRGYFEQVGGNFVPQGVGREVLELEEYEPLGRVCDRFVESVLTQTSSPLSSGWVGMELVEVLTALTRSLAEGGIPVSL